MTGKTRAVTRGARATGARVALVRARWNEDITRALESGAAERAAASGARVDRYEVAGSFELPAAVALLAESGRYDVVVPLGCLIRGETPHFEVLSNAVARGLMECSLAYPTAMAFGVLTCDTIAQARARAGGTQGHAGTEAMDAALEMLALRQSLARTASRSRRSTRASSSASSRSTR